MWEVVRDNKCYRGEEQSDTKVQMYIAQTGGSRMHDASECRSVRWQPEFGERIRSRPHPGTMMAGRWQHFNPVYSNHNPPPGDRYVPPESRAPPANPRSNYYLIVCYVCQEVAKPHQV
jgi:hypothetical protein